MTMTIGTGGKGHLISDLLKDQRLHGMADGVLVHSKKICMDVHLPYCHSSYR